MCFCLRALRRPGRGVRLFAGLERSLGVTADESGYFALPLTALRKAAPLPARLQLGQNYPNPFNPATIIPYQLPSPVRVRLEVFNILGQRVATLVDGARPAGFHTATWNATDASGRGVGSGVYLYRLLGGGERLTRSMVLLDGAVGSAGGAGSGGATAPARGEGLFYGLTVWGPGLVPYVDPAFRVGAGPVEIQVQPLSSLPRGKVAVAGGLLGDVNRDGRVDLADALLIASYSEDPTLSLGNGDITLGDVDGDGQVDLADARLIEAYHADPSDPSLPQGIGAPVGAGAEAPMLFWTGRGTATAFSGPASTAPGSRTSSTAVWSTRAAWRWTQRPASSTGPTTAPTGFNGPTSTEPKSRISSPACRRRWGWPWTRPPASSTGPTAGPTRSSGPTSTAPKWKTW